MSEEIIDRFVRVRVIDIDPKIHSMTCSCGWIQNMLIPCEHVMSVFLSVNVSIEINNVHCRWYCGHGYEFDHSHIGTRDVKSLLTKIQKYFEDMYTSSTSIYKGFPLTKNQYLQLVSAKTSEDIDILQDMRAIFEYNWNHGPIVSQDSNNVLHKIAPSKSPAMTVNQNNMDIDEVLVSQDCDNEVQKIAPSITQTSSAAKIVNQNEMDMDEIVVKYRGTQVANMTDRIIPKSLAQEMCRPIMNRFIAQATCIDDFEWLENKVEEFVTMKDTKRQIEKGKSTDRYIFGSDITNNRVVKRYRFPGETR